LNASCGASKGDIVFVNSTLQPVVEEVAAGPSPRSRFQVGLTYNLVGAVFNQGSTFIFNIVAANLLGPEAFGKYGMVASTLVALGQIAQLACGYTVTKYVAEYRSSDKNKTERVIGMLLVLVSFAAGLSALGLLVCASWLANSILKAPDLQMGLAIGAGVVFLNVLIGFFMGALAGFEAYRKLSRTLVLFGVFYLSVCTVMTWKLGLNGAFIGLFVSAVFGSVSLFLALESECKNQGIRIRLEYFPELGSMINRFALPAAVSGLTFLPALWLGDTILVRRPGGYAQMALFSVAYALMTAVLFIPNITFVVGWSLLNHHKGQGQADHYRTMFKMNLAVAGAAALAGASVLAVLGQEILGLFGKSFTGGYSVLLIMLAAAIPQALALAVLQHLQSQERMWLSFFAVVLPRDVLLVALAYYLIPHYGARGLALAYAVAWMAALLIVIEVTYSVGLRAAEPDTP
jgi:O-antigen/teichoic acid export membrane protein